MADKTCSKCKSLKSSTEFHKSKHTKSGLTSWCKPCSSKYQAAYVRTPTGWAKKKARHDAFNASEAGIAQKRKSRGLPAPTRACPSVCEACGGVSKFRLHLDHSHTTGKFRGWLCSECNLGFGKLGDTAEEVLRRVAYLVTHTGE